MVNSGISNANQFIVSKGPQEAAKNKVGRKQFTKSLKKVGGGAYITNPINISRVVGKGCLIPMNKVSACIGKTVSNIKLRTTGSYLQNFIPKCLQM